MVILKKILQFNLVIIFIFASGCATLQKTDNNLKEKNLTVGLVQKEIHKGMSQTEIIEALGSPNILTKDQDDKETWVYDKIATEASYVKKSNNIGVGGLAGDLGSSLILGILNSGFNQESGTSTTTQKSLTVIIKFDKEKKVEVFSYHASKF